MYKWLFQLDDSKSLYPINPCIMYGIVTAIYSKFKWNVGRHTIHGSYGYSIGNVFYTKHPFETGCLGFHDHPNYFDLQMTWTWICSKFEVMLCVRLWFLYFASSPFTERWYVFGWNTLPCWPGAKSNWIWGQIVLLQPLKLTYSWWKRSCATWDEWNPVNAGIFTISTGAGFLPSTVVGTVD